jgi:hypothetical protein
MWREGGIRAKRGESRATPEDSLDATNERSERVAERVGFELYQVL